jgi:hypothetical protein
MTTKYKNILHTLVIFLIITFLLYSKILPNFLWVMPELFSDFGARINWLECNSLGFDLITLENIDCGTGKKLVNLIMVMLFCIFLIMIFYQYFIERIFHGY